MEDLPPRERAGAGRVPTREREHADRLALSGEGPPLGEGRQVHPLSARDAQEWLDAGADSPDQARPEADIHQRQSSTLSHQSKGVHPIPRSAQSSTPGRARRTSTKS